MKRWIPTKLSATQPQVRRPGRRVALYATAAAAAHKATRRPGRRACGWVADSFAGIHLFMETTFRLASAQHLPSA